MTPTALEPPGVRSLWSANFRLYFAARTTSLLGDAMIPVALSVGVLDAGYGATGVGYALGAWLAAVALCMLFGGVLADRFTPRRMMVLADFARFVLQAITAALFAFGTPSLVLIVLLQFLSGAATAMFQPGVASMVPQVADDVQRANGTLRIAESMASVLGPALAGVLVGLAGPAVVFALYAATYAVSGVCLLALRLGTAPVARSASFFTELAEGWQAFRARTWLWAVIAIFGFYGCFVVGVSLPIGAELVIGHLGSTALGLGLAAFGAGGAIGGTLAIRFRPRRPLAVGAIGWALFAIYPVVPAVRPELSVLMAGWAVAGAGIAFWSVLWSTTVQTQVPPELLNRVYAYDVAGSLVTMALGRTVAGPLAGLTGEVPLMVFATGVGLLCAAALLVVPATRRLRVIR
ncbi:major facilitator superfamily MFS_1 [Kribbella flavida DSM 17836]|uniref:Major facilitator superfamily MFS_1 n=1 Tax=Kribbella flavida (strain DSM 17836 / JCM 10339 / NBRC 14399) TaxID=479435 RepID=D2PQB6_KRIFD|nr:MFS transporter [Kribbella flavida]ADB34818.1 major facilitator superfamily MFS_1 [Kribbella flavida DSM 17836]